jgi:hypothetical protein
MVPAATCRPAGVHLGSLQCGASGGDPATEEEVGARPVPAMTTLTFTASTCRETP